MRELCELCKSNEKAVCVCGANFVFLHRLYFEFMESPRIIISGGGTGGHIFPAVAIANAIKRLRPDAQVQFVGAEGRMEMEKVPAAGYDIVGLPVAGFDRKRLWRNVGVLLKLRKSLKKARRLVRDFKPDIAIGVGGYASGPMLKAAQRSGIPTLLQEQNSYAGVTNKLLAKKARRICVAYEGMERFFPSDKIVMTGNPVRAEVLQARDAAKAREAFGLDAGRATVLIVGGSLGARTLNESMRAGLDRLQSAGVQLIWQTGKVMADEWQKCGKGRKGLVVTPFIADMANAYAAADLVVSRAGAGAISEIELLGKPSVLVPSPNVAEDHQTKNARALESRGAAVLVTDADARATLVDNIISLIEDSDRLKSMGSAAAAMAQRDSDTRIAQIALDLIDADSAGK